MNTAKTILRIVLTLAILYSFAMIFVEASVSIFLLNPENTYIFIYEKEIPYVICLIALSYCLCQIWRKGSR